MTTESRYLKEEYSRAWAKAKETDAGRAGDWNRELRKCREGCTLKSMDFFYDFLGGNPGYPSPEDKRPRVGFFCNMVPEEMVLACGAVPLRLCSADLARIRAGENMLSADICPVVKSCCGSFFSGRYPDLDLLVIPAACDGKAKMAEMLSPLQETYFLDLPRNSDYTASGELWPRQFRALYDRIRDRLGANPSRRDLLEAVHACNRRTAAFRRIFDLRAHGRGPIRTTDYHIMAYAAFLCGPDLWAARADEVYREAVETAPADGTAGGTKLLLSGTPVIFPDFKILETVEASGGYICADTLCSAYGALYDPVVVDEDTEDGLIRSLALKYISASLCPCLLSAGKLIDRLIDMVQEHEIAGVIYHSYRLCPVFGLQTALLRRVLKERNIAALFLKTEPGGEDTGQLKIRLEAFLEMLR